MSDTDGVKQIMDGQTVHSEHLVPSAFLPDTGG